MSVLEVIRVSMPAAELAAIVAAAFIAGVIVGVVVRR